MQMPHPGQTVFNFINSPVGTNYTTFNTQRQNQSSGN